MNNALKNGFMTMEKEINSLVLMDKTIGLLEVQQGVWISARWLESAGLGPRVQVIVQDGEIRIIAASTAESENPVLTERGWQVFREIGKNARAGKLPNAARDHDQYLYGKAK